MEELDAQMRSSYFILTKNFTRTVNRFIVFTDGKHNIDIPHGTGQRSQFIDILIKYFSGLEEYEKCEELKKLRELVIMAGD